MRARLAKLAATSASLREKVAARKQIGLGGQVYRWAKKNPGTALGAGAIGALGAIGSVGAYRNYSAGFKPEAQQAMLGQTPTPPGTDS
jgi:hypothetical protein